MSTRPMPIDEAMYRYIIRYGTREDDLLARLRAETRETGWERMQVSPDEGALLAMLCRLVGARTVVEVGTFTGYSALCMARTLPADGRLIACDKSVEWTDIARRYWEAAGVADRVELRLGPALDTITDLAGSDLAGTVDLAFLDADKENYPNYYEPLLALLRPGGVLAIDNVFWGGSVLDPTDDRASTVGIRTLNERIAADDRVDLAMITVGDGVTVARKR